MNRLMVVILAMVMIMGCTTTQRYKIPHQKTKADFLLDREECSGRSGYRGGHFLFGPLIIIFPVMIVLAIIRANNQKTFEICMGEKGYPCVEGCWYPAINQPALNLEATQPLKENN
jgi:hypothetical protein